MCPEIVGPRVTDTDGDGCDEPDADGDGIPDAVDRCPDAPEDRDAFEDTDGCPDPDNDHDGILDAEDRCPDAAEVVNGVEDRDGCPDEGVVEVRNGRIVVDERVFFGTNSLRVRERSRPVLDAIATIIRDLPATRVVRVEGHADQRGGDRYNYMLSFNRALAVQQQLATRNIPARRLRPYGYGRTVPAQPGTTPEALAANRRVEIVVSGAGTAGVAETLGGFVRIDANGHERRAPEPAP